MSWTLLGALVLSLGLALVALLARRADLRRMRRAVSRRERAVREGANQAQLQHPVIDLSRCLGCGTCVEVCPEEGVLELVHGQAQVVGGARCAGVSACERECPVGAITVTLDRLEEREDVPALSEELEALGAPGLFLAGEVTAHALIKTAVDHGVAVGDEVARRSELLNGTRQDALDLVVVGAGPAGLACSLEAKRQGLSFVTLEQEDHVGGTVARYPRRKLVLTQPVDLPLGTRLDRSSYTKEELVELWQRVAREEELPIESGAVFEGLERDADGTFRVFASGRVWKAHHVCLALGRRGVPRKLGVPGEELSKVAYSLLDASSYRGRRILVVGGGDGAVEAALGLAEQPGNEVTLSYRKGSLFRVRARNEERLERALESGRLRALWKSEVQAIEPDRVTLAVEGRGEPGGIGGIGGAGALMALENDEVFVMAGGVPPLELLSASGVSFDPSLRDAAPAPEEQGTGFVRALATGFGLSLLALVFALWHADYYLLSMEARPAHPKHGLLRPDMGLGLGLGIGAAALVVTNLVYLLRRSSWFPLRAGSLRGWMTSHVATGILALLFALLHGAMAPRDTAGGQAFWALVVLFASGAMGRYFYAYVPRAANGRELELSEVRTRLERLLGDWAGEGSAWGDEVRREVGELVERRQWKGSLPGRIAALLGVQLDLRRTLGRLTRSAREAGVPEERLRETLALARRAHRLALMAAHFEDLRALLSSWRYLHRWVALLMVVLVVLHVAFALIYGTFFEGGAR